MTHYVIDTNVLIAANDKSPQLESEDIIECQKFLMSILNNCIISIDDKFLIFKEYFNKNSRSGQPGLGDAFVKRLWDSQYVQSICEIVKVTPLKDSNDFKEFIVPTSLKEFDHSDRKFIAVAIASSNSPSICNASDSDWWIFRNELNDIGVKIKFICPKQVQKWNVR